ncbi:MAG: lysylphosphatidylglycerol synthase transmembrane domain-containing protein [Leifsonia sp.]
MVTPGPAPTRRARTDTRWRLLRFVLRLLAVLVVAVLLWFIVIPQFVEAGHAIRSIRGLTVWPLLLALALEFASLASYGGLTFSALDPRDRPGFGTVALVDVTGVGLTNVLPGGGVVALAARYRLLARAGASASSIVGGLAVEVILSNLLLGGVFALGLVLCLAHLPPSPYYQVAGGFIAVIFGGAAIALALAVRRPEQVNRRVARAAARLPENWSDRVVRFVDDSVANVAALALDRRRFAAAVFWGAVNWLLDGAALWVLLAAFGFRAEPGPLLLVYGLVCILGLLPITPGGIGIVEGVMVPMLVAIGAAPEVAVLGVVSWRLIQFWMPMPLSALTALALMLRSSRRTR